MEPLADPPPRIGPASLGRRIGAAFGDFLLGLLWLIAAGTYFAFGARMGQALGFIYGLGVAAAFVALHVVSPRTRGGHMTALLRRPSRRDALIALLAGLAVTVVQVVWLLAYTPPASFAPAALDPVRCCYAILLFPLIEEFIFRGWLLLRFSRLMPTVIAALLSAVLFAWLHGQGDWTTRISAGLSLAAVLLATRSIWASFAMHAISNGAVVALSASAGVNAVAAGLSARHHGVLVALAGLGSAVVIAAALGVIVRSPRLEPAPSR